MPLGAVVTQVDCIDMVRDLSPLPLDRAVDSGPQKLRAAY